MNDTTEHDWEHELRARLRSSASERASVDAPSWTTIRARGRRRAHRRRTVVVAGAGTLGALGIATAVRVDLWRTRDGSTPVDVGTAPTTGPTTTRVLVAPTWPASSWMAEAAKDPLPPECAAYAAAHPDARVGNDLPDIVGPTFGDPPRPAAIITAPPGQTMPAALTPPAGAHPEYRGQDGWGFRRIVRDDGVVLFDLPVEAKENLQLTTFVADGWVYFGVESYPARTTTVMRASMDGVRTEELATVPTSPDKQLSPDGRQLALSSSNWGVPSVVVRDLAAGTNHEIAIDDPEFASIQQVDWDPDSEHLTVSVTSNSYLVDCRTGKAEGRVEDTPKRFLTVDPKQLRTYRVPITAASTADATLISQG